MKKILGLVLITALIAGTITGFAEERNAKQNIERENQKQTQRAELGETKQLEKPSKEQIAEKIEKLEKQLEELKAKYELAGKDETARKDVLKDVAKIKKEKEDKSIDVYVGGKHMTFDNAPFVVNGRAYVPIRAVSQALKADVNWDNDTKTVTITKTIINKKDTTATPTTLVITLKAGELTATVNGEEIKVDAAPMNVNGRIFVPIRFIAAAMKNAVNWDQDSSSVIIDDEDETTPEATVSPSPTPTPEASATPEPTEAPEETADPTETTEPTESPNSSAIPDPSESLNLQ